MKGSNLKILPAYRMYQAPEGGGEKPLRTSYLKDLSEGSASRGGGGTGGHKPSGHYLSGQKLSGQIMTLPDQGVTRWIVPLERAGSCPVVNLLHSTCQEPSDSGSIAKPTSQATTSLFKGLGRSNGDRGDRLGVIDTVTDRDGGADVMAVDNVVAVNDLKVTVELSRGLNESSRHNVTPMGEGWKMFVCFVFLLYI